MENLKREQFLKRQRRLEDYCSLCLPAGYEFEKCNTCIKQDTKNQIENILAVMDYMDYKDMLKKIKEEK